MPPVHEVSINNLENLTLGTLPSCVVSFLMTYSPAKQSSVRRSIKRIMCLAVRSQLSRNS
jgi:hypothetical protein